MMNNPRPVMSMRKTVQLMVILTLLAWATQTLFAQWGYGGLILPEPPQPSPYGPPPAASTDAPPAAKPPPVTFSGATIELRSSVDFKGDERVTLRDICRWSDRDAAIMQPLAGTLIANLGGPVKIRQITVDDIKSRLHDAGANLSQLHFTGSATCALLVGGATGSDGSIETPATPVTAAPPATPAPTIIDTTDPFANATDPAPAPVIVAEAPATQPAPEAEPIFEDQLVLTRPLSRGQRIIASDIKEQRVQVEAPATQPSIAKEQIVGSVASRDLKPGEVFDADDVRQPPVVTAGQFMTVAMNINGFDIETVARAMDTAATGETVRAKNEANGDVYRVVITGPNQGRVASERSDNVAALPPN